MRKTIIIAITLALFISVSARPANNFDPFLSRLQGAWNGEGTAFGSKATVQQKWEWTLNDKFLRLSLKYETKAADGKTQVFEGHGYYKAKGEGKYEGQWFDSQGNQYPINATLEGDALIALWGIPGRVEGKSTYRLVEAKQLEAIDAIKQKDGGWREFSRFNLRGANPGRR
jgi:hypothetical protein